MEYFILLFNNILDANNGFQYSFTKGVVANLSNYPTRFNFAVRPL